MFNNIAKERGCTIHENGYVLETYYYGNGFYAFFITDEKYSKIYLEENKVIYDEMINIIKSFRV